MIHFEVIARQGASAPRGLGATFGPEGGTIGRAPANTLVLDDPDRTVSRVHAQVLCREGQYFIVDRGSNPLHCEGVALGAGNEAALKGGERLVIGGFELRVTMPEAVPAPAAAGPAASARPAPAVAPAGGGSDPFADLLAGLSGPAPAAALAAAPAPRTDPLAFADPRLADPLGLPAAGRAEAGAGAGADPFADLLGPAPGSAASGPSLPGDDFSDLGLPAAARATASAQRIDELFGDLPSQGLGVDPLAMSPLADPLLQPNTAARDDPLAAFGATPAAPQAARSDHLPIGQFGFTPPKASAAAAFAPVERAPEDDGAPRFDDETGEPIRISRPPAAARPAEPLAVPPGPAAPPPLEAFDDLLGSLPSPPAAGAPASAGTNAGASATVAPPLPEQTWLGAAPVEVASTPQAEAARMAAPVTVPERPPAVASVHVPAASAGLPQEPAAAAAAAPSAAAAELLAAFLRGLGPVHQAPTTLTPALMERIGSLLRSSTEGTLQLLLTRQELKREVRAEVTMIAAQANNPLKFSPTADVALAHLLGPGIRGFMPAEAAMRDAYDDLRAHQFGVMVGMRAALERLIARFGPQELEKKIAARSALDSLFAANRKAKLWDQFNALYQTIASEAEDDFHALFGKAFLEAYEQQMARLKNEGRPAV